MWNNANSYLSPEILFPGILAGIVTSLLIKWAGHSIKAAKSKYSEFETHNLRKREEIIKLYISLNEKQRSAYRHMWDMEYIKNESNTLYMAIAFATLTIMVMNADNYSILLKIFAVSAFTLIVFGQCISIYFGFMANIKIRLLYNIEMTIDEVTEKVLSSESGTTNAD